MASATPFTSISWRNEEQLGGVFGRRVRMLGRHVSRDVVRHLVGRGFVMLVSTLGRLSIYDSQCGVKIFDASALGRVLRFAAIASSFDVELILELRRRGVVLHELPIHWADRAGGKVRLSRDILRMLLEVWKIIRRIHRRPS